MSLHHDISPTPSLCTPLCQQHSTSLQYSPNSLTHSRPLTHTNVDKLSHKQHISCTQALSNSIYIYTHTHRRRFQVVGNHVPQQRVLIHLSPGLGAQPQYATPTVQPAQLEAQCWWQSKISTENEIDLKFPVNFLFLCDHRGNTWWASHYLLFIFHYMYTVVWIIDLKLLIH